VIKPVIGGGGAGLSLVRIDDAASFRNAAAKLAGLALAQPLIAAIRSAGEVSLVFFAGEFSHAVTKRPKAGGILVQEAHGGTTARCRARPAVIAAARRILDLLPAEPLYARIDAVLTDEARADGGLMLMEVEVIEPDLFLTHDGGAPGRFADALMQAMRE
jgi:glutathione synthase/RimK-type ligase-like ATP-grasp enzyme